MEGKFLLTDPWDMESMAELKKCRNLLRRVKPATKVVKSFSDWWRKDFDVRSVNRPPLMYEPLRNFRG
jgi:hypothetical protein